MSGGPTDTTLEALLEEIARREVRDPLAEVYEPGSARHVAFHRSRKPIVLLYGANRAGKTRGMVADALTYCLERRTWAESPPPPVTVWYVIPSMTMWERSVLPAFRLLCPQNEIQSFREKPSCVCTFRNGSELHFVSADMRQRRLAGAEVHRVYMDETPDRRVFSECQARTMSTRGQVVLGFAPVESDSNWVRDEIYLPWQSGDRPDVDVFILPIADKETGEPLVPWFTKRDIDNFKRKWPDPQEQAARLYGEPLLRAGNVYYSYDPEIHVVPAFTLPRHWRRWAACDPQYYRFGLLFFTVDEHGNYFVTDELFSQQESLHARAERAHMLATTRGEVDKKKPIPVYVDSANQQEVMELNWHFKRAQAPLAAISFPEKKDVLGQTSRVQALLEPLESRPFPPEDPNTLSRGELVYGAPRLYFFESLHSNWRLDGVTMQGSRLIWEILNYQWGKDNTPNNKSADGADCCAALRYGCSIYQHTSPQRDLEAWKEGLSPADIQMWELIERNRNTRTAAPVFTGRDY